MWTGVDAFQDGCRDRRAQEVFFFLFVLGRCMHRDTLPVDGFAEAGVGGIARSLSGEACMRLPPRG